MKTNPIIAIIIILIYSSGIKSQEIYQSNTVYVGVNVNLYYKIGKNALKHNFPGIKAYVGFNSSNSFNLNTEMDGSFNLGSSITIYNKALGNSLNLDFQDNQIDWTTNFTIGGLWGNKKPIRHLQTINNVSFYNLQHQSEYATHIGVNFIMNNHGRNQTNGSISMTVDQFSMTYYNDGGPFFEYGLGDNFDRYWTGGLMLYWHDQKTNDSLETISYNRMEFTFDQFTGYKPQMFEITSIIGLDIQDYDIYEAKPSKDGNMTYSIKPENRKGYDFNASSYNVKYNFSPTFGVNMGLIGSLRDNRREVYYALQDIIHSIRRNPIHPNKNSNKLFIGFNYNNSSWHQK